jgi:hypothetical protein
VTNEIELLKLGFQVSIWALIYSYNDEARNILVGARTRELEAVSKLRETFLTLRALKRLLFQPTISEPVSSATYLPLTGKCLEIAKRPDLCRAVFVEFSFDAKEYPSGDSEGLTGTGRDRAR